MGHDLANTRTILTQQYIVRDCQSKIDEMLFCCQSRSNDGRSSGRYRRFDCDVSRHFVSLTAVDYHHVGCRLSLVFSEKLY
jgi:hypothetical protein